MTGCKEALFTLCRYTRRPAVWYLSLIHILKSLKHGGRLQLDEDIPYTAQMIATITRQQLSLIHIFGKAPYPLPLRPPVAGLVPFLPGQLVGGLAEPFHSF